MLYRVFLQHVLGQRDASESAQAHAVSPHLLNQAKKVIDLSRNFLAACRSQTALDWFSVKTIIMATLLIVAASTDTSDEFISQLDLTDALNVAIELFTRTAQFSEAGKSALQCTSAIQMNIMKQTS